MITRKKTGISCAGTFSPCVPAEGGDCPDKAVCGGTLVCSAQGADAHRDGSISVLGDFQNSAAQGPEHPNLCFKLAML